MSRPNLRFLLYTRADYGHRIHLRSYSTVLVPSHLRRALRFLRAATVTNNQPPTKKLETHMEKLLMGIAMAAVSAGANGETVNFDNDKPGALPGG